MKKINDKGWGLAVMLVFMGIFFLAILIISILSTKYGLLNEEKQDANSTNQLITTNKKYLDYEYIIKEETPQYVNKIYGEINDEKIRYVNINDLDIDNVIKEECRGYVEVYKNNTMYYETYIKCSNYETEGYNDAFNQ